MESCIPFRVSYIGHRQASPSRILFWTYGKIHKPLDLDRARRSAGDSDRRGILAGKGSMTYTSASHRTFLLEIFMRGIAWIAWIYSRPFAQDAQPGRVL
jgi:hypothetical protein